MLKIILSHISATRENEWLSLGDSDLEYTIESVESNSFYRIRDLALYARNIQRGENVINLTIRPKGKISPLYGFVGAYVGTTAAVAVNADIPTNVQTATIVDKTYIDNPNPVALAMLKMGYPEFSRIEDPNISQIKLELTGRDALKIKDIIIPDKEGNVVIACKYGRSWFYNYKNELPWYCDFDKATLADALSVAANVNKLNIFQPVEDT